MRVGTKHDTSMPGLGSGLAGALSWLGGSSIMEGQVGVPQPPQPPLLTPFPLQVSKIGLVDLAGSERADSSGATGMRLKVRG